MTEAVEANLPLKRWRGERGTYHLVTFTGEPARIIGEHALLQRLEFGKNRGFGSVKVMARIGETAWKTSVFPQNSRSEWILLISKKVMRAEELSEGNPVLVALKLL